MRGKSTSNRLENSGHELACQGHLRRMHEYESDVKT